MNEEARRTFDAQAYETVRRFRPATFPERLEMFADLDEHFTNVWLNYTRGVLSRSQFDIRTRLVVLVAQYTMSGNPVAVADTVQAAVDLDVDPRDLLEMILQCYIYGAEEKVAPAVEAFVEVVRDAGLLDQVRAGSLPVDATVRDRSLEEEREQWHEDDREDPRLEPLLERYGWTGISNGLRLRPGHHLNLAYTLDSIDPDFLALWLATPYEGLYARGVLDDRTRLLGVIGACLAVGETHQSRRHMRAALRQGAHPRDLLEVAFQTCAIAGHPHVMPAVIDDIILLCDELGRVEDVVAAERVEEILRIAKARVARRSGIADLETRV